MTTRRPLIAGNWKMHGLKASLQEFDRMVAAYDGELRARTDLMICPPATLIAALAAAAGTSGVAVGGQDCHAQAQGAHTGDIAAEMILDAGGRAVILGHSERRTDHGETDAAVRAKTLAAWRAGLVAVVCVGEHRQPAVVLVQRPGLPERPADPAHEVGHLGARQAAGAQGVHGSREQVLRADPGLRRPRGAG